MSACPHGVRPPNGHLPDSKVECRSRSSCSLVPAVGLTQQCALRLPLGDLGGNLRLRPCLQEQRPHTAVLETPTEAGVRTGSKSIRARVDTVGGGQDVHEQTIMEPSVQGQEVVGPIAEVPCR
jgi:hypothetical protein